MFGIISDSRKANIKQNCLTPKFKYYEQSKNQTISRQSAC